MLIWKQPVLPKHGIGIDPGLRCGLAFIEAPYTVFTLSLYINRAGLSSVQLLDVLQKVSILFPSLSTDIPVVVEGAAYNARFGQVILAEARSGLIMGMSNRGFKNVIEMPPRSIRKVAFGNGSVQPKEFWADHMRAVGKDGLDAASMAIAAGEG
jgi:Holliday junction resolvasome RuvABC endonuclease subunit